MLSVASEPTTLSHCSGVSVGLYLTSSAETCSTIATDCKAQVIVVENDSQLQKILEVSNLCVCVCVCVRACVCVCVRACVCVCVRQLCISETLVLGIKRKLSAWCCFVQVRSKLPHLKVIVQYSKRLTDSKADGVSILEVS